LLGVDGEPVIENIAIPARQVEVGMVCQIDHRVFVGVARYSIFSSGPCFQSTRIHDRAGDTSRFSEMKGLLPHLTVQDLYPLPENF